MNFLDLVKMRHSVRNYETRAVETEKLDYVLGNVYACLLRP